MISIIGGYVFLITEKHTPFRMDDTHKLDPDCKHVWGDSFMEYRLASSDGIVHCYYECRKCFGIISHVVGERLRPNQFDINELVTLEKTSQ